MLQKAYGESCLSRARIFDWYKSFKDGRTSLENLPHDRRPATSINEENVEKVKKIVLENRRVTEREIASELNISNGSAHSIIHDVLGMRRVSARLVPKSSSYVSSCTRLFDQKQRKYCSASTVFTRHGTV